MDKRAVHNVIRIGIAAVFTATGGVLGNLVATMVPSSLVKTYPLPIIFAFIALCIAGAWIARDSNVVPSQQPPPPNVGQTRGGMTPPLPWTTLPPTMARRPMWRWTFTRIVALAVVILYGLQGRCLIYCRYLIRRFPWWGTSRPDQATPRRSTCGTTHARVRYTTDRGTSTPRTRQPPTPRTAHPRRQVAS